MKPIKLKPRKSAGREIRGEVWKQVKGVIDLNSRCDVETLTISEMWEMLC